MGVIVQLIIGIATYTVLNPWLVSIFLPLFLLKLYVIFTMGKLAVVNRIDGKTAIVTGANTGLGFATAHLLAARGARVILACRNTHSAQQAKAKLISLTGNNNIEIYKLDLSSLWSVRQFAEEIRDREERVDILVNNAGVGGLRNKKTNDDLQIMWQINHFGPFLLTNLLLDKLKSSAPSRIIFVTSQAHCHHKLDLNDLDCLKTSCPWTIYCNTKLANVLTAKCLARKLQGTGVTVNCVHPGIVKTDIFRNIRNPIIRKVLNFVLDLYAKTPLEGASTIATVAIDRRLEDANGKYWADCKESNWVAKEASDNSLQERLWSKSEQLVDLKEDEKSY